MSQEQPKRSKLTLLLIIALLILGASGGLWWFLFRSSSPATEAASESRPKIRATLHLESFVVNLADPDANSFLRVGIDLGLAKPLANGEHGEEEPDFTGPVRDTIVEVLSSRSSEELLTLDGKFRLKTDLLAKLQARVPELHIAEVYLTDFVVQR